MLLELDITNFAIIENLHLTFHPGFNVLTGETGAGKSIIVDALGLLLGGRAQSEYIRAGADQTRIEGIFALNPTTHELLDSTLTEYGLTSDGDTLILARELNRAGRNVCRVNSRAVPLNVLEQIGEHLVDIHGQSEHLSLLRVREHIDFLDRFGNLWEQRAAVAAKVRELRGVRKEIKTLTTDARETARRIDRLTYVVDEISAAKLKIGEEEALKQERELLGNAELRANLADHAYRSLYGAGEDEKGALDLIGDALQLLTGLEKYDPAIQPAREQAESANAFVDDLARTLRTYRDDVDHDPERLAEIDERLDLIARLKRKYGDTVAEILQYAENAAAELATITHSEERLEELRQEETRLLKEIGALGQALSDARREAGERLARGVENELVPLGMDKAKFGVNLERAEDPDGAFVGDTRVAFDSSGLDHVEFLVSPNPGEPLKPLAKIASGGETSRLMLAMKSVLSAADRTPTLVFDEIDQGIGGRTGAVVGRKLWGLTILNGDWAHQVIVVTHLPQIASFGDQHFHIRKQVVEDRTVTRVRVLETADRVDELAVMLGAATEATHQSAAEMLAEASKEKSGG